MRILITGANRGLGLALTSEALKRGHRVLAGVRTLTQGGEVLAKLGRTYPGQLELLPLELTSEASVIQAAAIAKQSAGSIEAIINNAGVLIGREHSIEQLDFDEVVRTMQVNLLGPMRVVKHFLPLMTGTSKGVILNISSEAGSMTQAYSGDYPYALSKAALNMFSAQLAHGIQDHGVTVLSIHPGWIRTDMGGKQAPGDPNESARGILNLAEGKTIVDASFPFVDHHGQAMPI